MDDLEYSVCAQNLSVLEIQRFAQEVWDDVQRNNSHVRSEAENAGIPVKELSSTLADIVQIKSIGARVGIDPFSLLVGATVAGGAKVAKDIWAKIILPRLVARYGVNAIELKKQAKKSSQGNKSD